MRFQICASKASCLEILRDEREEVAREHMAWISDAEKWRTWCDTGALASHCCHGIGVLGESGSEVSKSAGMPGGLGCDGLWRYQSYLCCGRERAFNLRERSWEAPSISPTAKESRR